LLDQPPYLGSVAADFIGDLGSAYHDGGVIRQQAHNAAQAQIGGLWRE
jgi:hypothetical protein